MAHTGIDTGQCSCWASKRYQVDLNCSSPHGKIEPQTANRSTDVMTTQSLCRLQIRSRIRYLLSGPFQRFLSLPHNFWAGQEELDYPWRPPRSHFDHL
jgi:hypothetical protein